jgi:hypothetical protein
MSYDLHEFRLLAMLDDSSLGHWDLNAEDKDAIRWALARIETLRDRARRAQEPATLLDACRATLIFHGERWTSEERQEWRNITHHEEATTRVLCDTIRAAIAAAAKGGTIL